MSASALGVQESRSTSRIRVPGWANIAYADFMVKSNRLYDISQAGISLFLDIQLPLRQEFQLHLSVYHAGQVHRLDVRARSAYSTLVGSSGFRHGFQFAGLDEQQQETLGHMLA